MKLYNKPPIRCFCVTCNVDGPFHVHLGDLTNEAHFALWFALARIGGMRSRAAMLFAHGSERAKAAGLSDVDLKERLKKGLQELLDKSLLECERDGEGELVPLVLHGRHIFEQQSIQA